MCLHCYRYGISTKDVEMVLHVTLANMYCGGGEPPGMNYDTCYKAMAASVDKLWRLDPGNAWGALFTTMVPNNKQHRRKVPINPQSYRPHRAPASCIRLPEKQSRGTLMLNMKGRGALKRFQCFFIAGRGSCALCVFAAASSVNREYCPLPWLDPIAQLSQCFSANY